MSTIKVDTIATRTGSGNITASNTIAGTSATLSGTLGVTGAITGTSQTLNRSGNGDIVDVQKDGTSVGTIGANGSNLYIGSPEGTDAYLGFGNQIIRPVTSAGASRDNAIDLGYTGMRFRDIYLSGGAYLGGTGAANKLDDYEEGTWTPTILGSAGDPTVTYDTLRLGYYTKIGRHVFIIGRVRTDGTHSGGGDVQLSGLPFTESGINGDNYTSGGGVVSDSFGSNPPHSTMVVSNTNYFLLIYGNYNVLQVSHLSNQANANQIQFSFHYMTDA